MKETLINNELFNLSVENDLFTIEFHKLKIDFSNDKDFFDDAFFKEIKDKNIRLCGKSTVEIYAFASYWCVKNGCKSLSVTEFNLSRDFEIYRKSNNYSSTLPAWCSISEESNSVIASAVPSNSPDGRWTEDDVSKNASCFSFSEPEKLTILTGRGSLLFYSILACSASVSGCKNLVVEKPTEENFIVIASSLFPTKSLGKTKGIMIGILGDPNSGKSVFSKVLGNIFRIYSDEKSVWNYDCDAAAPTSDWYVYGLQRAQSQQEADTIKNTRKSIKQKWTEELEIKVSEYMKTVKSNLDFVIADFPGGRHDEEKNFHERIPSETRADMLKNCDYFIIIGRSDVPERINDWKKSLAEYNLEKRVIAEVISKNPWNTPLVESSYFDEENIFHASVCGLDRENRVKDIVSAFSPAFKDFTEIILSK